MAEFTSYAASALYSMLRRAWTVPQYLLRTFYLVPVFRARCESSGRNLFIRAMPAAKGRCRIYLGDDVKIEGALSVRSRNPNSDPALRIGNRGINDDHVTFFVDREVVIEDGVHIAEGSTIEDTDGYAWDPRCRDRKSPPTARNIKPVRLCSGAILASGCHIGKVVIIGEGAVITAKSAVLTDIPDHHVAVGNPARARFGWR